MNSPLNLFRLAGLPLSLTLLSILSGSVINRVMVVELGLPVILAGLFVAIPLLVSPVRIWLGHVSDAYPLWGRRREPYLILGACHPPSAHKALSAVPEVGVLLPCNVTVSVEGGATVVRAMDPAGVMGILGSKELAEVGADIGARLRRVVDACRG